jgi:hypothetical protein
MKRSQMDSVTHYFSRFQFPGGTQLYPLDHLNGLMPLRQVNTNRGGVIKSKQKIEIAYESQAERREIQRILHVLKPIAIKTQALAIPLDKGKTYYPDVIAQLEDGTVIVLEIKHILDMLWDDVQIKYKTLLLYCKDRGYGTTMMDGKWRHYEYLAAGKAIYFFDLIQYFEMIIHKKGYFTMQDLRAKFPQPKYWPTLVSYCLLNGFQTHVSFRDPRWAIQIK